MASTDGKPRVLVKEKIADSGVSLLREDFDVELGLDMSDDELSERIGDFDAIVVRSATQVTSDLIERASRLKVVGRAGTGVDNVDVDAATKRGIVVVNAPESNSVAAAEHTLALALALSRNVPRANASLAAGEWARSKFAGNELYGKTLGVIGFGRIGQLVAKRAQAFEMEVIAFDKFVAAERFRELGVEHAEMTDELYAKADIITIHLPKTPDTVNWIDAEAISQMKDGVRIVNCARGELVDLDALEAAIESGKVGGAALDVFPSEPFTEHPLFGRDNVVVTPHLGASTAEAQDRAGTITADQVRRALSGGVVTNAVNIAAVRPETMEALAPFVPLCERLGRLAQGLSNGSVDRITAEFRGRIADHDTRLLGIAVLVGILSGHTEEQVNLVNAPALAEERGIDLTELKDPVSDEFTELVTVRIESGRRHRRGVGYRRWPAQPSSPRPCVGRALLHAVRRPPRGLPLQGSARDDRPRRHDLRDPRRQHRLRRGGRGGLGRRRGPGAHHRRPGARRAPRGDPEARGLPRRPGDGLLAGLSANEDAGVGSGRCARWSSPATGRPRCSRSQERPDPPVRPGEVRIAVKAAGINFADTLARVGLYPDAPKLPCVVGYEVAGEVESVGEGVEAHKVGDRVIAGTRFNGQAELVTVPAAQVLPLPKKLSFEEGAAFPVNYGTAYAALVIMGGLREGERVLIHAAAGGVGHLRDPDREGDRRRDLRHGVRLEARRDPRAGRGPPDRLPQPPTSRRRSAGSRTARAWT